MKYKVGDKVMYDSGDWRFYGTVSAIFESSINPCYRLSVERMEKKNCKFTITQFEFEIEPDHEDVESIKDERKWENAEIEYLKKYYGVLNIEDLSKMLRRSPQELSEKWRQIQFEREHQPEPEPVADKKQVTNLETTPEKKQRKKRELKQEAEPEKVETVQATTKAPSTRKTSEAWDRNLDLYLKGEKSNTLNAWVSYNRKQNKTGELAKDKLEKLLAINFPFDVERKKSQIIMKPEPEKVELKKAPKKEPKIEKPKRKKEETWNDNFEKYRKGEKSNIISTWMADNRKQYRTGAMSAERLEKLIEIKFPFEVVTSRKADSWDRLLEEWKKGDRKSIKIQQWKQRSVKRYVEGKLSGDRILKLREAGILK